MMKCVTGAFLQSCEWAQDKLTERDVKLMISGRSGGSGTSENGKRTQLITGILHGSGFCAYLHRDGIQSCAAITRGECLTEEGDFMCGVGGEYCKTFSVLLRNKYSFVCFLNIISVQRIVLWSSQIAILLLCTFLDSQSVKCFMAVVARHRGWELWSWLSVKCFMRSCEIIASCSTCSSSSAAPQRNKQPTEWRNHIAVCVVCRAIRQVGEHIYLWANCWSSRHSLRPNRTTTKSECAKQQPEKVDEPRLTLSGNKLSTIRPLRVKRDFYWASSSSVISPRPISPSDEWGNSEAHGPAMLWVAGSFLWNI